MSAKKIKILVADDSKIVRLFLESMFSKAEDL